MRRDTCQVYIQSPKSAFLNLLNIIHHRPKNDLLFFRLVPNEEETAAERCSEKLVDLVVLLTTKLDNNVEDLRKELTDNINENIERFERVQQQQEEEYGNKMNHFL